MLVHDVLQGSDEWLALRMLNITASEACAMLNQSKYMTRAQLIHMKATGEREEPDANALYIFDKGHKAEDMARPIAEEKYGVEFFPVTGTLTVDGVPFLASYDGLDMGEEDIFEHKLYSIWRNEYVSVGEVPPMDRIQLEIQLMVCDGKRAHFMISNLIDKGDKRREPSYAEYESDPILRRQIIDAGKELVEDIATYKKHLAEGGKANNVKDEVKVIKALPALNLELAGKVKKSTLTRYSKSAAKYIAEINTELKEDSDFANAENDVKFCKKAEKHIESVRENALSSTASIKEAMESLDKIQEDFRKVRLSLERSVKTRKEQIKTELISEAEASLSKFEAEAERKILPYRMPRLSYDYYQAIKGKRNIESIRKAIAEESGRVLSKLRQNTVNVLANMKLLEDKSGELSYLFSDFNEYIMLSQEQVGNYIDCRINEHNKRLKEELEAAKAAKEEASRKAQAELDRKAEEAQAELDRKADAAQAEIDRKDIAARQELEEYAADAAILLQAEEELLNNSEIAEISEESALPPVAPVVQSSPQSQEGKRDAMNEAYFSMGKLGFSKEVAKKVISAISEGQIDNVTLNF